GMGGAACILGAKLAGQEPVGTMPHAFILIVGDTVRAALAYHERTPARVPRLVLVDTFTDEAVEALRVAEALGSGLPAFRFRPPNRHDDGPSRGERQTAGQARQNPRPDAHPTASGMIVGPRPRGLTPHPRIDLFSHGSYNGGARQGSLETIVCRNRRLGPGWR